MKRRMLLYFGSFDPIHNGHLALAEYAVERDLADEVVLIISPQNPFKADARVHPLRDGRDGLSGLKVSR